MDIQKKIENLPHKPGVYLFRNSDRCIIYIGKAKILRNRVRSYFQKSRTRDAKTERLVSQIVDLEIILTDSEVEALILESNLVKQHKPKYNVNLKDDKTWPYIRITNEPFPRVFPTRKVYRDGSRYFGPYTDVGTMKNLLKTLKQIFPLRNCKLALTRDKIAAKKFRVCLAYHIKQCPGPCEGFISQQDYGRMIDHVSDFIAGRREQLLTDVRQRMFDAAERKDYEYAAYLRDQLNHLTAFQEKQKIIDSSSSDRDLMAVAREDKVACAVVFQVRGGKMIGRQHFYLETDRDDTIGTILQAFLPQYYLQVQDVPSEICLPCALPEEGGALQEWLNARRGGRVVLAIPKRGVKAQLLRMSQKNARLLLQELKQHKDDRFRSEEALTSLQIELGLANLPQRIEAFDVSTIQGSDSVASMVSFFQGRPDKNGYRHFRIRGKSTLNDFAMMREAVLRRYRRLTEEKASLPDLILIDGGKGQLSAALSALEELDLHHLSIASLAKRLEEVYLPGQSQPLAIAADGPGVLLLRQIRDEAHRFAVTFHRKLRKKRTLESELDRIEGIGPRRRESLIATFGTIDTIRRAEVEEIAAVAGISHSLAEKIIRELNSK
ncbi:excinuclease ABC subunit C [candidate division KSB1 bacterium]|nr:excinuclease ABC subunit C [candidate division KSB1 bacterium]